MFEQFRLCQDKFRHVKTVQTASRQVQTCLNSLECVKTSSDMLRQFRLCQDKFRLCKDKFRHCKDSSNIIRQCTVIFKTEFKHLRMFKTLQCIEPTLLYKIFINTGNFYACYILNIDEKCFVCANFFSRRTFTKRFQRGNQKL